MDNRRLFLAALLSMVVLIVWQLLFAQPKPEPGAEPYDPPTAPGDRVRTPDPALTTEPSETAPSDEGAVGATPGGGPEPLVEAQRPAAPPLEAAAEEEVLVETNRYTARFTNRGGQLLSFRLNARLDTSGEPLELVKDRETGPFPLSLLGPEGQSLPLNEARFVVEKSKDRDGNPVVWFRYRGSLGAAEKRFHFIQDRLFSVRVRVEGRSDWGLLLGPGLRNPSQAELDNRFQHQAFHYLVGSELEDYETHKVEEPLVVPGQGLRWIALDDSYFLTALIPVTPIPQGYTVVRPMLVTPSEEGAAPRLVERPAEGQLTEAQEEFPATLAAALHPGSETLEVDAYWGAKEYEILAELPYGLEQTVHWFLGVLARPLLLGLRWIHDHMVQNYGWAIILMTLVIKIVLFPLTHKSYISMQKMQRLNPRVEAIRQKYRPKMKDKKGRPNLEMQRKMNEEMQQLWRSEGVNPVGGCFPMLLQIPVFLAFYSVLRNAVELWSSPWILWITDLSIKDPFYLIPIVMGATQFLQQRLTPMTTTQPGQRMIMATMPIWFTFISFGFPSGLVLYWLTNNVLTIVQQGGYNRLKKAGWLGGADKEKRSKGGTGTGSGRTTDRKPNKKS